MPNLHDRLHDMRGKLLGETGRVIDMLPSIDPIGEEYFGLLRRIDLLLELFRDAGWAEKDFEPMPAVPVEPLMAVEDAMEQAEKVADVPFGEMVEVVEDVPMVEVPKEEQPTEPKEYTSEEVRSLLADITSQGVLVRPIIEKYVPEGKPVKFSSIPKDKYPALVKELEDAK